jgi:hypothetical protein
LPFERLGEETGAIDGSGIGLTISKHLIELMHGNIGFNSDTERGSKFWVDLPISGIAPAQEAPSAPVAFATEDADRVIVVRDEKETSTGPAPLERLARNAEYRCPMMNLLCSANVKLEVDWELVPEEATSPRLIRTILDHDIQAWRTI